MDLRSEIAQGRRALIVLVSLLPLLLCVGCSEDPASAARRKEADRRLADERLDAVVKKHEAEGKLRSEAWGYVLEMTKNGLVKRTDLEKREFFVDPILWAGLPFDVKQKFAATMALSQGHGIKVRDYYSGGVLTTIPEQVVQ